MEVEGWGLKRQQLWSSREEFLCWDLSLCSVITYWQGLGDPVWYWGLNSVGYVQSKPYTLAYCSGLEFCLFFLGGWVGGFLDHTW